MSFFKILSSDPNDYELEDLDESDEICQYDEYGEVQEYDDYLEITTKGGDVMLIPFTWLETIAELFQHNITGPTSSLLH